MRRKVIISVALHTLAAVAGLLWLLWYFIPTGNVFNGLSTALIILLAGWYVFKNCRHEEPVSDANLPAAELPLLDAEGPVVLVCGDMLDALFQGSTLRKTAQGWWLRVGDVSRLTDVVRSIQTQFPHQVGQLSVMYRCLPDRQLSLKSGEGPVEVQAQNASLRLFAEKKLTLSSASDISFAGKKRITLIGGGSYLRLEAGKVEYGTTATYIRKVKRTMFAGANSTPTPSISMPLVDDLIRNGFFDEQFRILDDSGKPMANVPYFISSENGETFKGVTDNQGLCKRVFSKESAKLTVWLGVLALERW